VPVQLARRPAESIDETVAASYDQLLRTLARSSVGHGTGELLPVRPAWPGNATDQNLVVVQWRSTAPDFDLAVVNLAPDRSQGYVGLTVADLNRRNWRLRDLLGTEEYHRYGDDLQSQGLYLDLPPHAAQLFHFEPTS
jgi:hypothetical protein